MAQIITEQKTGATGKYWIAYVKGKEANYSLGDSKQQAIDYLKKAIADRPDIYGK